MKRHPIPMCPIFREATIAKIAREEYLEHDKAHRKAALELLNHLFVRPLDIMEINALGLAFPGLSYALEQGFVHRVNDVYTVSARGLLVHRKLEISTPDPDLIPRVLLKARALGGQA